MNPATKTSITLYGLKTCDTCRKALAALAAAGHAPAFDDIRTQADLGARLPLWLAALGPDRLVNTRSTTWRSLPDAERARLGSDPAGLLAAHPTLIRRPVIEAGDTVHAGWTAGIQSALGV